MRLTTAAPVGGLLILGTAAAASAEAEREQAAGQEQGEQRQAQGSGSERGNISAASGADLSTAVPSSGISEPETESRGFSRRTSGTATPPLLKVAGGNPFLSRGADWPWARQTSSGQDAVTEPEHL